MLVRYTSVLKSTLRSLDVVHDQALKICTGWYLQNIIHQINDVDFWTEVIGSLQKPTEHKF